MELYSALFIGTDTAERLSSFSSWKTLDLSMGIILGKNYNEHTKQRRQH